MSSFSSNWPVMFIYLVSCIPKFITVTLYYMGFSHFNIIRLLYFLLFIIEKIGFLLSLYVCLARLTYRGFNIFFFSLINICILLIPYQACHFFICFYIAGFCPDTRKHFHIYSGHGWSFITFPKVVYWRPWYKRS